MHAVVIRVSFTDVGQATAGLPGLVAQVSSIPGFVTGTWVHLSDSAGAAMVVFDSEEAAHGLAEMTKTNAMEGVVVESAEVGDVVGHA